MQICRTIGAEREKGQVLVIGLFVIFGLSLISISVANVGIMVAEKIHVQDSVDAAAYSAAVVEARYMNTIAYINRAMIANYNAMAFNTGLWTTAAAKDHGSAAMVGSMYIIAGIIQVIPFLTGAASALDQFAYGIDSTLHSFFHELNENLDDWFAQDETDVNQYIETYVTDILSTYEGLLYAVMQAGRHRVIEEVIGEMDPRISSTTVLGLGAETVSGEELRQTVDWIIEDPELRGGILSTLNQTFNRVHG